MLRALKEHHRIWHDTDRARRSRIHKAVRRGEAVHDLQDARLAIELAQYLQQLTRETTLTRLLFSRTAMIVHALLLAGSLIRLVFEAREPSLGVLPPLAVTYATVTLIAASVWRRRIAARARTAERLNRALLP